MSEEPREIVMEDPPPSDHDEVSEGSEDESEPEAPAELMVTSRARRSNAGNRMSTLLAKSAEEEEWGEEWEEAPNEEEFQGDDINEQEDYNMDSSSSEEGDDDGDEDDAGEKELRKAERQEKNKKRKAATNPFTARVAAVARKKTKLDLPRAQSPTLAPPRPKKKSERASWLPTEEDGPVRMSKRKQTIANKDATLAKLKEKDRRRDDTLAMMKAAEARKLKAKEKPPTQAERLAEAARNERINKKTLHRWEEAEEARAAERQAKIDALKNRQIDGPFYRYYSGPGIWVDDKLKYTGKDAPTIEHLEEKLNKEIVVTDAPNGHADLTPERPVTSTHHPVQPAANHINDSQPAFNSPNQSQISMSTSPMPSIPAPHPPQQNTSHVPWTAASQGGDVFMGSHGMSYPNTIQFAPPSQDSFLFGIDQYAQNQQSQSAPGDLPPNPFTQASPFQQQYATSQPPFSQTFNDHTLPHNNGSNIGTKALLAHFQKPALPPPPPRRKVIRRTLRNLLILSNFPNLEAPPPSSRTKSAASLLKDLKDKDKSALLQLYCALFQWTPAEATAYLQQTLAAPPKQPRKNAAHKDPPELLLRPGQKLCPITNQLALYRDPETGIAYRDARAFGVLRGVVGGGFVWSGDLGCYVGGRAKPLESMGGKGFLGMPPAKNVPRRFWDPDFVRAMPPPSQPPPTPTPGMEKAGGEAQTPAPVRSAEGTPVVREASVVVTTPVGVQQSPAPVKTETGAAS